MIPYEREIFVDMIVDKLNREKQENQSGTPVEALI
jgi:hypothetical protein